MTGDKISFRVERTLVDALDGGREYDVASTFEGTVAPDGRSIAGTRTSHPCSVIYDWSAKKLESTP